MGETKRQTYTFSVMEYGDGTPYVVCEPVGKERTVFGKGHLSFVLRMGISLKAAKNLAAALNEKIDSISFTKSS
jgi:hypothetical protein